MQWIVIIWVLLIEIKDLFKFSGSLCFLHDAIIQLRAIVSCFHLRCIVSRATYSFVINVIPRKYFVMFLVACGFYVGFHARGNRNVMD